MTRDSLGRTWLDGQMIHDPHETTEPPPALAAAPASPNRVGGTDDTSRDISGETVCGFRVAAYRETHPEHGDRFGHSYSEHWSTPNTRDPRVKVERLFTEDQLRQALASPAAPLAGENVREALADYARFAGETAGKVLALAMSTEHPDPDTVLMGIFHASQALAGKHRALLASPIAVEPVAVEALEEALKFDGPVPNVNLSSWDVAGPWWMRRARKLERAIRAALKPSEAKHG